MTRAAVALLAALACAGWSTTRVLSSPESPQVVVDTCAIAVDGASPTGGGVRATETPERARLATIVAVAAAPAAHAQAMTIPLSVPKYAYPVPHANFARGVYETRWIAAPATLTISGHAPMHKQGGSCGTADTTRAARCTAVALYQIGHRHPLYRRGDEFDAALWARDVAYGAPIQVASVGVVDGQAFAFTVPFFQIPIR